MMILIKKLRFFWLTRVKWRKYKFGKNPYIGRFVYMWARHNITIGDNFYIGKFSQIECDTEIGNNVIIANHVGIIGKYDHNYQEIGVPVRLSKQIRDRNYNWKGINEKIVIEDDVWIGYGSIILSGVTLGQGCIIAAGSLVASSVPPFKIYGGVPAKMLRERFDNELDLKKHIELYNLNYT